MTVWKTWVWWCVVQKAHFALAGLSNAPRKDRMVAKRMERSGWNRKACRVNTLGYLCAVVR